MKRNIILKHGGGELANQLWNYLSIYAYSLETKSTLRNPSFFEYHSFFNFLSKESFVTKITSSFFKRPRRRSHPINKFFRLLYAVYTKVFILTHKNSVISSENRESRVLNLPPTEELPLHYTSCEKLYFSGWLFRNLKGIAKFETELREIFTPHKTILERVNSIILPLRKKYTKIIGVHIRQSDYKDFKGGIFIIHQSRIRTILDEYIKKWSLDIEKTVFLIASDGPIDTEKFSNLNISISKENSVTDLFLLSKTDSILGSDSSFGAFSSWYGNIPHILFKNEAIEWDYYKDKSEFFPNKHSVLNRY